MWRTLPEPSSVPDLVVSWSRSDSVLVPGSVLGPFYLTRLYGAEWKLEVIWLRLNELN